MSDKRLHSLLEQVPDSSAASANGAGANSDLPAVPEARHDLQILRSIRRIIRAVDIYSRKLKATCQLTAPQLVCLSSIVENGPTTISSIARSVYLGPSTVVGIVDRLEKRDLVRRERRSSDRRVVDIVAAEAGIELLAKAPSALQDGLAEAVNNLPEKERATIAGSLERVVDLMEAKRLDAAPILETDAPAADAPRSK